MEAGILNVPIYRNRSSCLAPPVENKWRDDDENVNCDGFDGLDIWAFFLYHNPAIPVARPLCITQGRAGESLLLVIY